MPDPEISKAKNRQQGKPLPTKPHAIGFKNNQSKYISQANLKNRKQLAKSEFQWFAPCDELS